MNNRIAKTFLILSCVYMAIFYVIKFAFPQYLLLQITDPNIVAFGKFIGGSKILTFIFTLITNYITFYLFACSSRGSFKINKMEFLYIFVCALINKVVGMFLPSLAVHTSTSLLFVLAILCKGNFVYTTISFIVYGYASQFLLTIRGFETIIQFVSVATGVVLGVECWVWLIIFTLIFKIREEKKYGLRTTLHR